MRFPVLATAVICAALACSAAQAIDIRSTADLVIQSEAPAATAFIVCNHTGKPWRGRFTARCVGGSATPSSSTMELPAHGWKIVPVTARLAPGITDGKLVCAAANATTAVPITLGADLTTRSWRWKLTPRSAGIDKHWADPAISDADWAELRVPRLWEQNDYAWCRVHINIPGTWKGHTIRLNMAAVDDNDVTYLNGREVGRTNGWDTPRSYVLPARAIRWDEDNVITVMVDNPTYGGGLYKAPIVLAAGTPPAVRATAKIARAIHRPAPSVIGKPLPFRPMHVANGVLRYQDGGEVALWGTNCYPQSWHEYANLKRLHVDMKATIREDMQHLARMGVEAIRIHVFDREISDSKGHIIRNEHLDLLDYQIALAQKHGIYFYLTPIAWWGSPNELPGAFSAETSKPGMMFSPEGRAAAVAYLRSFLTHVNPYTRRKLKDEPNLCFLEVMNEPAYFTYGDMAGTAAYEPQGERMDVLAKDRVELGRQWRDWTHSHGLPDTPTCFAAFRYDLMRAYIHQMVGAIRGCGARQPIAISYFGVNGADIGAAIADSECDAVTTSTYPGGWEHVNDGINLIPAVSAPDFPADLAGKARVAYEFDTPATNTSSYLYPVIAARFRQSDVQIACQFQYDSAATARWNTDWNAHWLNWLYTPSKIASYLAAREAFHAIPRGTRPSVTKDEMRSGAMAISFTHNQSLFATHRTFVHARAVDDWHPLPIPADPDLVIGVGSSPLINYNGSGLYVLRRLSATKFALTVNPDVHLVGNSLRSSLSAPAAELESTSHAFHLRTRAGAGARCWRVEGRHRTDVAKMGEGWLLSPGEYIITTAKPR